MKPFINYAIKSNHNSYIINDTQFNLIVVLKSIFGCRNKPVDNNKQLINRLIELLNKNFKFFEFDITTTNNKLVIQHTTILQGRHISVSKAYDFEIIMNEFINYLNLKPFNEPIFIYFETSFNNKEHNKKLSETIKKIFKNQLLENPIIDFTTESPFDNKFKNKIIFVSDYDDETILSAKLSSNVSNKKNEILNISYNSFNELNKCNDKLKRVYVSNILTTTNQPFIKNCNIFSINYLPNEKNYKEYDLYMNTGYKLII